MRSKNSSVCGDAIREDCAASGERSTCRGHSYVCSCLSCSSAVCRKPQSSSPNRCSTSRAAAEPYTVPPRDRSWLYSLAAGAEPGRTLASCVTVGISCHPAWGSRNNASAGNTSQQKPTVKPTSVMGSEPPSHNHLLPFLKGSATARPWVPTSQKGLGLHPQSCPARRVSGNGCEDPACMWLLAQ